MVEPERIAALATTMTAELRELDAVARLGPGLVEDGRALRAAKYSLLVVIGAAIDVAHHVIASEGLRSPSSYADAFDALSEAGLLADGPAATGREAARFRNLLVHVYADVSDARVAEIVTGRLDELRVLRDALAALGAE